MHIQLGPIGRRHGQGCWHNGCHCRRVPHSNSGDGSIIEGTKEAKHLPINLERLTPACTPWAPEGSASGCIEANAGNAAATCSSKHAGHSLDSGFQIRCPPTWSTCAIQVAAVHLLKAPFEGNLQESRTLGDRLQMRTMITFYDNTELATTCCLRLALPFDEARTAWISSSQNALRLCCFPVWKSRT